MFTSAELGKFRDGIQKLGETVGLADGDTLGAADGLTFGLSEGNAVGDPVGAALVIGLDGAWYQTSSSSMPENILGVPPQRSALQALVSVIPVRHSYEFPRMQ